MLESMALMKGLTEKMAYLQTRQRVISQNITNSDTPNYQAMEVKAPDFAKVMGQVKMAKAGGEQLNIETTSENHIDIRKAGARPTKGQVNRHTYDVTPSGNSVTMEEQMMQASQTAGEYQLITNLYNKQLDTLRSAMRR
jgi:flagellar basal-body rod protein FlgB